ncbi:hypothetical protein [Ralstonia sp. UBA689]|uniref:hypothetical protein n=1 Tax=Ralstonia sp. UBA689 TaxID=1947373 RepID=UPI0025EEDD13|nr:hypothetical protein [Ralstonia sp. UBA689]
MPAGFQAFNTGGVLQIDENYVNLGLVATGQVMPSAPTPDGYLGAFRMAEVSANGVAPIIAVRANYAVALGDVRQNGATWTFRLCVNTTTDWDGTALTYYIFDQVPAVPHGIGLQVFRGDGVCTFDSNYKYFNPVGAFTLVGGQPYTLTDYNDYTGLPPGTYAVVLSMERMDTYYWVSEFAISCGEGLRALPNGVRMRWTQILVNAVGGNGGGDLFVDQRSRQVLLIDVSNI